MKYLKIKCDDRYHVSWNAYTPKVIFNSQTKHLKAWPGYLHVRPGMFDVPGILPTFPINSPRRPAARTLVWMSARTGAVRPSSGLLRSRNLGEYRLKPQSWVPSSIQSYASVELSAKRWIVYKSVRDYTSTQPLPVVIADTHPRSAHQAIWLARLDSCRLMIGRHTRTRNCSQWILNYLFIN